MNAKNSSQHASDLPPASRPAGWRTPYLWGGSKAHFGLGVVVGLVALYLAIRDVQWAAIAAALSQANSLFLLLALGSVLLTNWAKALRWQLLFYPRHRLVPGRSCVFGVLIGQLANNLLPARLGELVRAYLIGESTEISKVFALATIVVEKALDSVMLLVLVGVLSLWMPMPSWLRRSSFIISAVLAMLLLAIVFLAIQRRRIVQLLEKGIAKFSAGHIASGPTEQDAGGPVLAFLFVLKRMVEASAELGAVRNMRVQLQLWAWSTFIWGLSAATNALVLCAVHIDVAPVASFLLLVVLMAGAILPTSPLHIGVFHYLCILTLAIFGVGQSTALGYAFLLHLLVYLPIVIGGAIGLSVENYYLGKLPSPTRGEKDD